MPKKEMHELTFPRHEVVIIEFDGQEMMKVKEWVHISRSHYRATREGQRNLERQIIECSLTQ